ncbi:UNVERIFIED_CONTAM: hypothetical protein FKN15_008942 [Acipenser sinensis]
MAQYDPSSLPPNAEEKDFIQAYENVREKYKGTGQPDNQCGGPDITRALVNDRAIGNSHSFFVFCCFTAIISANDPINGIVQCAASKNEQAGRDKDSTRGRVRAGRGKDSTRERVRAGRQRQGQHQREGTSRQAEGQHQREGTSRQRQGQHQREGTSRQRQGQHQREGTSRQRQGQGLTFTCAEFITGLF